MTDGRYVKIGPDDRCLHCGCTAEEAGRLWLVGKHGNLWLCCDKCWDWDCGTVREMHTKPDPRSLPLWAQVVLAFLGTAFLAAVVANLLGA